MEVRNQVLMLGKRVSAEVSRRRESHRRWLWLGPWEGALEMREVEVPEDADPEEWPTPDTDPIVVSRESFPNLDTALAALEARGYDVDAFDAIWKAPNPF
jgi:hypothetical protein